MGEIKACVCWWDQFTQAGERMMWDRQNKQEGVGSSSHMERFSKWRTDSCSCSYNLEDQVSGYWQVGRQLGRNECKISSSYFCFQSEREHKALFEWINESIFTCLLQTSHRLPPTIRIASKHFMTIHKASQGLTPTTSPLPKMQPRGLFFCALDTWQTHTSLGFFESWSLCLLSPLPYPPKSG